MTRRRNAAYLLVRATLGLLFLLEGLGRLAAGAGGASRSVTDVLLPQTLVAGFGAVQPFLEIALGALLLAGLFTGEALVLTGALLIVLTSGLVLLPAHDSMRTLAVAHVLMTAALLWLESLDAWALDRRRVREDLGPPPARLDPLPPLPRESSRRWVSRRTPRDRARPGPGRLDRR